MEPLEARAGRRLGGPWRDECFRYFAESADGWCAVRDDVMARPGVRSLIPYFVAVLRGGDHRAPALPPRQVAAVCPECKIGDGQHFEGCELAP